jgi:exosortase
LFWILWQEIAIKCKNIRRCRSSIATQAQNTIENKELINETRAAILLSLRLNMPALKGNHSVWIVLGGIVAALLGLCFATFFRQLLQNWIHNEQFSYGLFIPPIVGYLIWKRSEKVKAAPASSWTSGFLVAGLGCALQILASRSGTLLLSGIALVVVLLGMTGFLYGSSVLKMVAGPLALLILMVPLPSYIVGQLTWYLQSLASSGSGRILEFLGVPIVQDGNLLRLPNYILEVKQACSGSNSVLSLVALALIMGLSNEDKWWKRSVLVLAAPVVAIVANVIRIVGTGLIARQWGSLAANESLHVAWGVAVFLLGLCGLIAIDSLLRSKQCAIA